VVPTLLVEQVVHTNRCTWARTAKTQILNESPANLK
jgi:hypothetical protein